MGKRGNLRKEVRLGVLDVNVTSKYGRGEQEPLPFWGYGKEVEYRIVVLRGAVPPVYISRIALVEE